MANESGTWIMHGVDWNDPQCIHSVDEAIEYINEAGFLPLFKNDIPGFSLEERTAPEHWWSGDPTMDPWVWRELIARRGSGTGGAAPGISNDAACGISYGKFFDKKAGFISREWIPCFANYRRDGYDFDALWDDEKASIRQKKIMDLFAGGHADDELYSYEIKKNAGFGKDGEKNFEGTITDLMMSTYLCMCDFRRRKNKKGVEYGWNVAVYSTFEHVFGAELVTSAYGESAEKSGKRIYNHMRNLYPAATEKQLKKALN